MQAPLPQFRGPIWLPPVNIDTLAVIMLVIFGANIDIIPDEYRKYIANPLAILIGMLVVAGFAALGAVPLAFAIAFALVNLVRIIPKNSAKKPSPGVKEGFVPSGAIDWVTTNKKWFVEKVLMERPVAIQEKEVSTYPING